MTGNSIYEDKLRNRSGEWVEDILPAQNGLALNQNILLRFYYIRQHHNDTYGAEEETGLTRRQYLRARASLKNRGYLRKTPDGASLVITGRGIRAIEENKEIKSGPLGKLTGVRTHQKATIAKHVWKAIRTLGTATVEELAAHHPEADINHDKLIRTTRRILSWWHKAGIIRKLHKRQEGTALTSNGHIRYRLVLDLGPKHPITRVRKQMIYDQNERLNVLLKEVYKTFRHKVRY